MGKPLCQDAWLGQNSVEKTWHSDCTLNIYERFTVWTCTNTMQFQAWYSLILHFYSPSCPCHHSSTPVGSVWLSQMCVCVCVWLCVWLCMWVCGYVCVRERKCVPLVTCLSISIRTCLSVCVKTCQASRLCKSKCFSLVGRIHWLK